jgi:hypothetical protein
MAMCDPCYVAYEKWLDFRGRGELGIRIQIVGNGSHTIPTHRRTAEIVYGNMRQIKADCEAGIHVKGA